jgi:hypothetical protein
MGPGLSPAFLKDRAPPHYAQCRLDFATSGDNPEA